MFAGPVDFGPVEDLATLLLTFIFLYVIVPVFVGMVCAGVYLARVPKDTRSALALFGAFCAGAVGALLVVAIFGLIKGSYT